MTYDRDIKVKTRRILLRFVFMIAFQSNIKIGQSFQLEIDGDAQTHGLLYITFTRSVTTSK